jgi:uncharacterized YigZ family protein
MARVPGSSYLTIARDGEAEVEAKRSRFLCWLRRVHDEESARAVVERARGRHREARHHCSAFVLGPGAEVQRSSDDGEPAGTAGAPMLEVLRGRRVSDVVAVVIRYFGGTLLGAGGLVRAYSDAVRAALDDVGVVRRQQVRLLEVTVGHAEAGRVEHELRSRGTDVREVRYAGDGVSLRLGVTDCERAGIEALLAQTTLGAAQPREVGADWIDVPGP